MAPTSTQVIQSKGIYLGLPTFPSELKNLKAIVAGANGISGQHMLRALSEEPERWSEVYALSRRPPLDTESLGKNIKHLAVDFLSSPDAIAKSLQEEKVQAYASLVLKAAALLSPIEDKTDPLTLVVREQRLCLLLCISPAGTEARPVIVVKCGRDVRGQR